MPVSRSGWKPAALATLLLTLGGWLAATSAQAPERRDLRLPDPVTAADAYALIAELWGLDLVIDEGLAPGSLRVDLEDVTWQEALDLLTLPHGRFWWVDGEGRVRVDPDTPNRRREVTPRVRRTYRPERAVPSEVLSALRTFAPVSGFEATEDGVELEVLEPRVDHADLVVAAMDGQVSTDWSVRWLMSEAGLPVEAPDPRLGAGGTRRLWFAKSTPRERLMEAIESAWDVDLILDPATSHLGGGRLRLEEATLFEALDALTVPAGSFWTLLGGRRIMVAEDSRSRPWTPLGFAVVRLDRSDPGDVRRVLQRLGVRQTAIGSSPPLVLVQDTPGMLAVAELVVETLEGRGPLAMPGGKGRLWLGTRNRPRLAEAQLMVDPATPEARRRALAAAEPPELGSGPEPGPDTRRPPPGWARRGRSYLLQVLQEDLGLHVGLFPNCRQTAPRWTVDPPATGDRTAALRRYAAEHSLLWTAIGRDTVLLAQDGGFARTRVPHWGVAVVPMDPDHWTPVYRVIDELELEAHVRTSGPHPLLFVAGPWEHLGALLEAGRASPEPVEPR